jgi:hypothetical protein
MTLIFGCLDSERPFLLRLLPDERPIQVSGALQFQVGNLNAGIASSQSVDRWPFVVTFFSLWDVSSKPRYCRLTYLFHLLVVLLKGTYSLVFAMTQMVDSITDNCRVTPPRFHSNLRDNSILIMTYMVSSSSLMFQGSEPSGKRAARMPLTIFSISSTIPSLHWPRRGTKSLRHLYAVS